MVWWGEGRARRHGRGRGSGSILALRKDDIAVPRVFGTCEWGLLNPLRRMGRTGRESEVLSSIEKV